MLNNQRVDETRRNSLQFGRRFCWPFEVFFDFWRTSEPLVVGSSAFFLGSQGICWFVAAGLLVCIDVDGATDFLLQWPDDGLVMGTIFGNLIYLYNWISFNNHFEWPCYNHIFPIDIIQNAFALMPTACQMLFPNFFFDTPTNEAVDVEWCWRVP